MSETDPWAKVEYERGLMGDTPSVQYDRRDLVDAARAAEAAQHQQEIAAKDAIILSERSIREHAQRRADHAEAVVTACEARLAAVEAERDKAQRALATAYLKARRQASVCEPNEDQFAGAMAVVAAAFPNTRVEDTAVRVAKPEEQTELVVAVKRRAERAEAERDRLKAALEFYANPFGRLDSNGERVTVPDFYAEMEFGGIASAALTPQGQSTDGETR